jgi:hypothetical protein
MHFCRAKIAIGGDHMNVYNATEFDPVSWPEIAVLQQVHGYDSISDVEPFAWASQHPRAERQRLAEKYREEPVGKQYTMQGPNEMDVPGADIAPGVIWLNPLTGDVETTQATAPAESRKK